jgi:GT2 family glycosyltransferase
MVAERHPWVQLVRSEENLGFGRAVNLVARRTDTTWVAPANADLRFEPGALAALLAAGEADPGAGVVAPRLILPDGSTQPSIQPFPGVATSTLVASRLWKVQPRLGRRLYLSQHWDPDSGGRVGAAWATGAFFIVRRAAYAAVGGFDEHWWMYGEDLDLGWRLHRAGWPARYEPRAIVHHVHSAAAKEAFGDELDARWLGATYAWIMRRQGRAAARLTGAVELAEAGVRIALSGRGPRREAAQRDLRRHRLGLRAAAGLAAEHQSPR